MTAKIVTESRHITPAGGDIFADLGFDEQEAKALHADSLRKIENTLAIKEKLMGEITIRISDKNMKQADVATVLNISRPCISDVVKKKDQQIYY